ncbi:MAG: Glu-tRNA(Gln) amidotransferase subunit GatE [Candidatus Pacearchaeota archaeon]
MMKKEEIKKDFDLRCGLEIHQQLDTNKLFCNCPSILRQDVPNYTIKRKLHLVAGEEGEVDIAAKHESMKEKSFIYECYYYNVCLVDLDEEPPREINQEALKIALQISLLLNCEILQNTQIMRKIVIDGSNVSGFQRTVLIAKNGYVDTDFGKVRIAKVILEEDAARIIKEEKNYRIYRLDRLGIPLVEITTYPDIKNAQQAKQVALKIGEILRACKVKRGLGTIRQDINMSVNVDGKQGARIEIKGVQEPDLIEKTILREIERQKKLIRENKSKEEVKKALKDGTTEFLRPLPGASRMYPETDLPLLHISRDFINKIKENLPKLKSEIKSELEKKGLHKELIKELLEEKRIEDFEELLAVYNNPELIAKMLTVWRKEIEKKTNKSTKILTLDVLETIIQALQSKKINESDVKIIMEEIVLGKSVNEALKREKIENIEEEILKIIKEKPGLTINAYMGLVMSKFKGKINGKEAYEIIKTLLNKKS